LDPRIDVDVVKRSVEPGWPQRSGKSTVSRLVAGHAASGSPTPGLFCDDPVSVPSQFSAVGFNVSSGEDLAALASRVSGEAERISTPSGEYLKWAPPSGEQLWLQITRDGDAMGMVPHFAGKSSMRLAVEARVARPSHTPLDGTFLAWANPPAGAVTGGDYPFAFDCPDAATHLELALPATVTAQMAAFAQQISLYESAAAYATAQAAEGVSSPSRSFIPSGLLTPDGEPVDPPQPHALIAGHVLEAAARANAISGTKYWWALIDTVGGTFDVVIDPALLPDMPRTGNVLAGWFWLSGRLLTGAQQRKPARSWMQRLVGR
jgi:hypothetical protein